MRSSFWIHFLGTIAHSRKFRVRAVNAIGNSEWSKGSPILNCRRIFPEVAVKEEKKTSKGGKGKGKKKKGINKGGKK